MRQSDRAGDPVGDSLVPAETSIPVEGRSPRFHRESHIAKPQWPKRPVLQQVKAYHAKAVLQSEDSHVDFAKLNQLRVCEEVIFSAVPEFFEPLVQVYSELCYQLFLN